MQQTWTVTRLPLSSLAEAVLVDETGVLAVTDDTARWFGTGLRQLANFLGDVEATAVSPRDVSRWVNSLVGKNLSVATINSYLRSVKTAYGRAAKLGLVGSNPAASVRFLPELRPSPKAISRSDYEKMLAEARHGRDRAMLAVLWDSGCRLGGLLSMRVDRVDELGNGRFALYVVEKGNKPRWVYVGREAAHGDMLRAWLDERPTTRSPALFLSFTAPPHALTRGGVQHTLHRLRLAAGIPGRRPTNAHSFRHAAAIRWLDEGVDLATVSAWLGHYSPEFTAAVYAIRSESQLRERYFET